MYLLYILFNFALNNRKMRARRKKKISIETLRNKIPKIVFYTDKIRVQLSSLKSLDFWLKKHPNGKYVIYD